MLNGIGDAAEKTVGSGAGQLPTNADLPTFLAQAIASQGEAEAGSENTKRMTALRVAQAIAAMIPARFTSSPIVASTLATGDQTYSAAHGFGAEPFDALAVLKCTTTDLGYPVGQSIILRDNLTKLSSSSIWGGFWVGYDATNIYGHQEDGIRIPHNSTKLVTEITYASWSLYLRAVA